MPQALGCARNPWFDSISQPAVRKLAYPCHAGVAQRVGECPSCLNLKNGASGGRRPTMPPFSPCLGVSVRGLIADFGLRSAKCGNLQTRAICGNRGICAANDASIQPKAPKLACPCPAGVAQRVGGFPSCSFCKILLILSKTILFEVGGANKRRKQLPRNSENEFVVKDGILVGSRRTIPLHLLGFLY
jgi:hypothetical protein